MIVLCAGDSFTYGMELYEEKYIPGYLHIKTQQEAFSMQKDFSVDEERFKLSYTGYLKNQLNCDVINLGKVGSSEIAIVERTVRKLNELKSTNEKIVCILQDTGPNRLWLWHRWYNKNDSLSLPNLEWYWPGGKEEAYKIQNIYMKYIPDSIMYNEYYLACLSLQHYCCNNNIDFLHFHMYNNQYSADCELKSLFFDERYCVHESMYDRLEKYYGNKDYFLPGLHVNCDSHIQIGKWLIEELTKRKLI